MRDFARKVSDSDSGDESHRRGPHGRLPLLRPRPRGHSSGALRLYEPVQDRAERTSHGWKTLALANLDAARPGIRRFYRLPPQPGIRVSP